ncbi:alanine--tRNA ligase [Orientia chuto str. Dubai]|uniref:Alanine--tRNA ligase n=1 Tax=Orientia chuto str. Dubai TaxID=1359168 RepID=A0A0F3MH41_9RICK|nr:alanine--tRNA ligase [Candidatus Orientia mediorientalis]KJV55063.1 alanine--tRNA ligase [Orientia chuto str. Dubai]
MSTFLDINQIRTTSIEFFKKNNHHHVSSSPLVPDNDPSLFFVNAGIVQFKDYVRAPEISKYSRVVTCQKCVRAGGKHNDLESVGYTARHHTFFEMLGNFSFGENNAKPEFMDLIWKFLTKELLIDKNRLIVTVYHTDHETAKLWQSIAGLDNSRIIRIKTDDNFWSMGATGPCGPCTEIFYDHGDKVAGGLPGTKDEDGGRYTEIWNIVFMQYDQLNESTRVELKKRCIDTGAGLERIATVLQGVYDNYDIDLFKNLIANIEHLTKVKSVGEANFSHRIIADHLRASAFLIADGVMPSNEGRGYVLRRIMRRAMNQIHQLGCKEPIMHQLVSSLINEMGDFYKELRARQKLITYLLKNEEEKFKVTLLKGLKLLEAESKNLKSGNQLSGKIAFKLYDTYGFPFDLTQDILKTRNISVNKTEFDQSMLEQKNRARQLWKMHGSNKEQLLLEKLKEDFRITEFVGYSLCQAEGIVVALIQDNQYVEYIDIMQKDQEFWLIANQTPFYAQSGGQMGDIGIIKNKECKIHVIDTIKLLGYTHVHVCKIVEGRININAVVHMVIDQSYRTQLQIHHSATHILHAALREILGNHIIQKGSLVAYDYLRFDVSHSTSISKELLTKIENRVNEIILSNTAVQFTIMPFDQAISQGAVALFEEKYGDEVRTISIGETSDTQYYSFELCGGTHVKYTGDIGAFRILSEGAIAAGVRRIEAIAGKHVIEQARKDSELISQILEKFSITKQMIMPKIDSLIEENNLLKKQLHQLKYNQLLLCDNDIQNVADNIGKIKFIYKNVEDYNLQIIRKAISNTTKNIQNLVMVVINKSDNKNTIIIGVSNNIINQIQANNLVKEIINHLGGSGGGNISLAQIGCCCTSEIIDLKNVIYKLLINMIH